MFLFGVCDNKAAVAHCGLNIMQEHPVPQNVTGYEFHLIGQMTLRQFFLAGAGVGIAVLANITNLPAIIKWPVIAISVLGGLALAFIPYEGRPLDKWFFAFIRSIYQPTMFFWKKTNPTPEVFDYTPPPSLDLNAPVIDPGQLNSLKTQRVSEFLETMSPNISVSGVAITDSDDAAVNSILAMFTNPAPAAPELAPDTSPTPPKPTPPPRLAPHEVFVASTKTAPMKVEEEKVEVKPEPLPAINPTEVTAAVKQAVIDTNLKPATTSQNLPFPKPPTKPNMIVGMVISKDNKIVDNAIVEIIHRADGAPMRAMKTNTLGQFAIVTPLANGDYEIVVEKDGYQFDRMALTLKNEVVMPLLVQAK